MNLRHTYTRQSLWLYVPLWVFFAYLFQQIITFDHLNATNLLLIGMGFITFGIHEASHLIFIFLPNILVAAAGSAGEILFTLLIIFASLKARSYFAVIFGGLWFMLTMNHVGTYIADARAQVLPLIGPSPEANHDWHFILNELNLLPYDKLIGSIVSGIGDVTGAVGLVFGLWLLIAMGAKTKQPQLVTLNK